MAYIKKIFDPTFSEIRRMETMTNVEIEGLTCIPPTNKIVKRTREFLLSFDAILDSSLHKVVDSFSLGKLRLFSADESFDINNNAAYFMGYDFMTFEAQTFRMSISDLKNTKIEEEQEYYMRMILPIDRNWWIHDIHSYGIESDYGFFGTLLYPNYEKGEVDVFSIKEKFTGKQYMVVEPCFKVKLKELYEIQYSVAIGLGLITGTAIFDEAYIAASKISDFSTIIGCSYMSMRQSIKSQYRVFTTNMYSVLASLKTGKHNGYAISQLSQDGENPIKGIVNWMEEPDYTPIFSNLYKYPELARAVVILIDGTDKALDYQAAMYSVALETICTKLKEIYGLKYNGIINKEYWKPIRKQTQDTLIEGLSKLRLDDKVISRFVNRLSGMNEISNAEKFVMTIAQTGLELSEIDKNALKQRNFLLHGNLVESTSEDSDMFEDMYYYSVLLHTLCCKVLFKFFGYSGYLVNGPVIMDRKPACDKKEPVLIKL